jgi:hypothetical protein
MSVTILEILRLFYLESLLKAENIGQNDPMSVKIRIKIKFFSCFSITHWVHLIITATS